MSTTLYKAKVKQRVCQILRENVFSENHKKTSGYELENAGPTNNGEGIRKNAQFRVSEIALKPVMREDVEWRRQRHWILDLVGDRL